MKWLHNLWFKYGWISPKKFEYIEITKYDLFKAAALAGLLARAGVIGSDLHNPNIKEAASAWASELTNENSN